MNHLRLLLVLALGCAACGPPKPSYLFVWAGDNDRKASDFLGVIDATPGSPTYGTIVASLPVGEANTSPHHTEQEMPENLHLLANGFGAGRTWLFDLSEPRAPQILASFGAKAGFTHPHSFVRMANGDVLATFQYLEGAHVGAHEHPRPGVASPKSASPAPLPGGLVLMNERGDVIRSAPALDGRLADSYIYPYHVLPIPSMDRVVSSTTDMNDGNKLATSEWLQVWRLSDLTLLRSIALEPGSRGDENQFTGELRLLPDGKSVYVHTFSCGLYLVRDLDQPAPRTTLVKSFLGSNCGVPVLIGHYWLQPVPDAHALIALDISNPERPREVSSVNFGSDEGPHWVSVDPARSRVVVNSAGSTPNRLFIVDVDTRTGKLTIDRNFRDIGGAQPGITLTGKTWPHGFNGYAKPHGTVFSR
jgi:hypothetical protein